MAPEPKVNILLVDDQPGKLLSYEAMLQDLGENLIKAGSAREALEHLLKNDITIVLIDVVMPDLDGFELAEMIRSHPRFQSTAIIFVSAVAMTEFDRVRGYEHGAVDYVSVPVVPELLRAKVRVFAELYRKTRQLERLNAELEERVRMRTAELAEANADLEQRVEQRTREREFALAQVHEMQKLESLGKLTGGLAHDFNNLLMVIKTSLDLLAKRLPPDPRYSRLIEGARQSTERGVTLTSRMLSFARRQELKPQPVDVRALIEGMVEMLQRTLGPTIQIGTRFAYALPQVLADPGQLELALLNLALNGRDAMPEGGGLTVSVQRMTEHEDSRQPVGEFISIRVTDTGTGMDEATLQRAAEPFFTTKGTGKGTGLGLSMVHGLAAQLGGSMQIRSSPGRGTTVELCLPVARDGIAEAIETEREQVTAPVRGMRVLVVDDDPLVAELTDEMLRDLGYEVVVALSATRALELLQADAAISVVLTDHAMPGVTGLDLARQLRATRPELPVVLATGYAELAAGDDLGLLRLSKPYDQEDIARLLGSLAEGAASDKVIPLAKARRDAT